ncbi:MAG: hypothetical protein O3B42_06470 [Actinomycetota bacterium]|nr:hypothetical protein [Actinomycetota bacterium]
MTDSLDAVRPNGWLNAPSVDVDQINSDLEPATPTVDVAMYYPDNLDKAHREKVNIDLMVHGFREAKKVFANNGVQLKLVFFKTGHLDTRLFSINSTGSESHLPRGFANMYVEAERHPSSLPPDAEAAFNAMVANVPGADRIVHIVVLQDVFMSFFEQLDFRTWQLKTISTGGLSFPGYMYGSTMPRHLRGVITITDLVKGENSWKTIAHEIGHKVLNVSHEHADMAPQHEVNSDEGLMFYGDGAEILAGREGRFHHERLHVSPYVYRTADDGSRDWNPDYVTDGFYYDAIYDGINIDLDAVDS